MEGTIMNGQVGVSKFEDMLSYSIKVDVDSIYFGDSSLLNIVSALGNDAKVIFNFKRLLRRDSSTRQSRFAVTTRNVNKKFFGMRVRGKKPLTVGLHKFPNVTLLRAKIEGLQSSEFRIHIYWLHSPYASKTGYFTDIQLSAIAFLMNRTRSAAVKKLRESLHGHDRPSDRMLLMELTHFHEFVIQSKKNPSMFSNDVQKTLSFPAMAQFALNFDKKLEDLAKADYDQFEKEYDENNIKVLSRTDDEKREELSAMHKFLVELYYGRHLTCTMAGCKHDFDKVAYNHVFNDKETDFSDISKRLSRKAIERVQECLGRKEGGDGWSMMDYHLDLGIEIVPASDSDYSLLLNSETAKSQAKDWLDSLLILNADNESAINAENEDIQNGITTSSCHDEVELEEDEVNEILQNLNALSGQFIANTNTNANSGGEQLMLGRLRGGAIEEHEEGDDDDSIWGGGIEEHMNPSLEEGDDDDSMNSLASVGNMDSNETGREGVSSADVTDDTDIEEGPYQSMPKQQLLVYDHHVSKEGKFGAIQSGRVLLQLKGEEATTQSESDQDFELPALLSLNHIPSNKMLRGLQIYNPTTKHLNKSELLSAGHDIDFKKLPWLIDHIFKSAETDEIDGKEIEVAAKLLHGIIIILGQKKQKLRTECNEIKHRLRFEFYIVTKFESKVGDGSGNLGEIPFVGLDKMVVPVDSYEFTKYLYTEIEIFYTCLANFFKLLDKCSRDKNMDKIGEMSPNEMTTVLFCSEQAVESLKLIGFEGVISRRIRRKAMSVENLAMKFNVPDQCLLKADASTDYALKFPSDEVSEYLESDSVDDDVPRDDDSSNHSNFFLRNSVYVLSEGKRDYVKDRDFRSPPSHVQFIGDSLKKKVSAPALYLQMLAKVRRLFYNFFRSSSEVDKNNKVPVYSNFHIRVEHRWRLADLSESKFVELYKEIGKSLFDAYDIQYYLKFKDYYVKRKEIKPNEKFWTWSSFPRTKNEFKVWYAECSRSDKEKFLGVSPPENSTTDWVIMKSMMFENANSKVNYQFKMLPSVVLWKEVKKYLTIMLRKNIDEKRCNDCFLSTEFVMKILFLNMHEIRCHEREDDSNLSEYDFILWNLSKNGRLRYERLYPIWISTGSMGSGDSGFLNDGIDGEEGEDGEGSIRGMISNYNHFEFNNEKSLKKGVNDLFFSSLKIILKSKFMISHLILCKMMGGLSDLFARNRDLSGNQTSLQSLVEHIVMNGRINIGDLFDNERTFKTLLKNLKNKKNKKNALSSLALRNKSNWEVSHKETKINVFVYPARNESLMKRYLTEGRCKEALMYAADSGVVTIDFLAYLIKEKDYYNKFIREKLVKEQEDVLRKKYLKKNK